MTQKFICMSKTVTTAATPKDGRQHYRRAKSKTYKRRRRWPLLFAVGTLALFLVVPFAMYVWRTRRTPLPARIEEPLLPRTYETEDMKGLPPPDEDSSEAPAPSAVVYPADIPYAVTSGTETHQYRQPHIRRMRARLQYLKETLVLFQEPSMTAVFHPYPVENSVVLLIGDSSLSIGSLGVNESVQGALIETAMKHSVFISKSTFRDMLGAAHRKALHLAISAQRGRLRVSSEKKCRRQVPIESTCTFIPKDDPTWDVEEVGPFSDRRAFLNAILLLNAYNRRNKEAPLTRILVPPLWPETGSWAYRSETLAMDCLKTLRYAAEKKLLRGITVEFLADGQDSFLFAARELEEKYRNTWWR